MAVRNRGTAGVPRWCYDFTFKGVRYKKAIPEARTEKEAKEVEGSVRLAVRNGTYNKPSPDVSFQDFVMNEYLNFARLNKRSFRQDEYYAPILCEQFKGKKIKDINALDVDRFMQRRSSELTRRGEVRSKVTVNRELAMLSKILNLAEDYELRARNTNPCHKRRFKGVHNRRERYITHDEESRLLNALEGCYARLKPIMIIALYAGLRRGEIMRLEWRDVDLNANEIRIPRGTTKSGKGRVVPFGDVARKMFLELRGDRIPSGRLFQGTGFHPASVSNDFAKVCRAVGLHDVMLHTLRHTYATRLKDAGVDPFTMKDLLGHTELRMTDHYTHATPETMRQAVVRLEKQAFCANDVPNAPHSLS